MSQAWSDAINEGARREEIRALALLDSGSEQRFDEVTTLVADIFGVPTALITLVGDEATVMKSAYGFDRGEISREASFCGTAITSNFLEVRDACTDQAFYGNPMVVGPPYIRFYAGATLYSESGAALGTLCIIDYKPRQLDDTERRHLQGFAKLVEIEMQRHAEFRRIALDLQRRALHDPATGLPGASLLEAHLARTLTEAGPSETVWVAHLHLVNFETLQLVLGVHESNQILKTFAVRLQQSVRPIDQVGWLGINRFAVALRSVRDIERMHKHMVSLVEDLGLPSKNGQGGRGLQVTAGVSHYPNDAQSADTLLEYARIANGEAQRAKVGVEHYSADLHSRASRRQDKAHRLFHALEARQLRQVYQPIVCAHFGQLVGVEALARWWDPIHGEVSPGEFVPLAESDRHARRLLTEWSIDQACRQLASWEENGFTVPFVSVNIAARELFQPDFVEMVQGCLRRYGTSPCRIVLEVTEQSLIVDIDKAIDSMSQLRNDNIRFAIDDFGTGYSSLKYLQRLPVDFVKVDRSFTATLESDEITYSLIEGVVKIANSMALQVVIEGIETEGEHRLACQLGENFLQGFLFGRPVGPGEIVGFEPPHTCSDRYSTPL